jgi:MSHA biogenesis protein MshQ
MRHHGQLRWMAWLAAAMLAIVFVPAHADAPITLLQSFAGHVNFTGVEATMRTGTCSATSNTLTKTLSNIPLGSSISKVYLYWAGSGATPDNTVNFKSPGGVTTAVTAARQYTGAYTQSGTNYYYFSGVADVTNLVTSVPGATGNGSYSFSGLTIDTSYCSVQGVLGGFALLVVYTNPNETYRVLNLYEGFRFTHADSITLSLSNFRVPNPIGSSTGRFGHITWEGDPSLSGGGEELKFNTTSMTDAMNPSGNQFNSASNIDGDNASLGIDFDVYTVGSTNGLSSGDTSASTTYASGQDLVWLNAEIVAVPNTPVSDLKVAVVRSGTPALNGAVTYTATVSSAGPENDAQPITVTNQLPDGMTYVSATGTGWTCATPSGQSVTCTYAAGITSGATLPAITIKATVTAMYSSFIESVTVSGTLFDNVPDNNTASDVWTNVTGAGYMFTDKACVAGYAIGSSQSKCSVYIGPYTAGTSQPLYITYHNGGVATAYNRNDRTVSMRFSLTCFDPAVNAGIAASYGSSTAIPPFSLPTCTGNGAVPASGTTSAWTSNVTIYFYGGQPSGTLAAEAPHFIYNDVGQIQLNLYDATNRVTASSPRFTSIPALVRFTVIQNSDTGTPDNASGFAMAGETFNAYVRVEDVNGNRPPNFGKETTPYSLSLGKSATAGNLTYTIGQAANDGTVPLSVIYDDLGSLDLTATLTNSGAGAVAGTYFKWPVTTTTRTIGVFYPAYFTTAASGGTTCLTHMSCPTGTLTAGESKLIDKFVYSRQPFGISVSAFSQANTDLTSRLSQMTSFTTTLSVNDKPGSTGVPIANSAGTPGTLTGTSITLGGASPTAMPAQVTFALPVQWNAAMPHPSPSWDKPASIYPRAAATFQRRNASGTAAVTVSSNRGTAAVSVEKGIEVVNGRLLVDNANGSELIKLPLYLHAQYWNGYGWENNGSDTSSVSNSATFTNCTLGLIGTGTAPNNCGGKIALQSGSTIALVKGAGTLWVAAPGAGRNGSATVTVPGGPAWLPTTSAQAVFGTYRSKFVYIREVY